MCVCECVCVIGRGKSKSFSQNFGWSNILVLPIIWAFLTTPNVLPGTLGKPHEVIISSLCSLSQTLLCNCLNLKPEPPWSVWPSSSHPTLALLFLSTFLASFSSISSGKCPLLTYHFYWKSLSSGYCPLLA